MKIINDNLWNSNDDIILVTGNSYINQRGELVMGRGAALELKEKFPSFPKKFGTQILSSCGHLGEYNLIFISVIGDRDYGIFQVKYHYRDNASLDLINRSVEYLIHIANYVDIHGQSISMNFPGIGWGRLNEKDVRPILEKLPNNVTIYKTDIL